MTVQGQQDIDGILRTGAIIALVRDAMLASVEPGMTTAELDAIGARMLEERGARSAPRVVYDFPGATCISVNEEAAHGIPGARVIQAGDIVNVDVSAEFGGYFADTGGTTVVPPVSKRKARLCAAAQQALDAALLQARAGAAINSIGLAIETVARSHGLKVIKNLGGHGIGRTLHEEPDGIIGWHDPADLRRLELGQVVAIEPFLSTRNQYVMEAEDGWTLIAHPDNRSAQFEHTVIITRSDPIIATRSASAG